MKLFSELYLALKRNNPDIEKTGLLIDYFSNAYRRDSIWALYFLTGGKLKRAVKTSELKELALEFSGIPDWLFDESYGIVDDVMETISLILPAEKIHSEKSLSYWIDYIEQIRAADEVYRKNKITEAWKILDQTEKYIFNKMITGNFRSVVNEKILVKALSELLDIETNIITRRLNCEWHPDSMSFNDLFRRNDPKDLISKPYQFLSEQVLETGPEELGVAEEWYAERKLSGIRSQLILRKGELFLWTSEEELVTDKFPEFESLKNILPEETVIEGVILCYNKGKPLPPDYLKSRSGRKNAGRKTLPAYPAVFTAFDIFEYKGNDVRSRSLTERKELISNIKIQIAGNDILKFSEELKFKNWNDLRKIREGSGEKMSEGILLKRRNSIYQDDSENNILLWKHDPVYIDAVLMYAMKGERTDLFTELTFGVWDEGKLVSVAKVNSGLTENEITEVNEFVKNNTLEKFGPVRTVRPELVFEIAFESISESKRHKSGVVLHFPEIKSRKKGMNTADAATLENVKKHIKHILYET